MGALIGLWSLKCSELREDWLVANGGFILYFRGLTSGSKLARRIDGSISRE